MWRCVLRRDFGKCGPGAKWGLEIGFFKQDYNFGTDDPRDLNFFKRQNEKILDTCLGVFQNLDQGPGGALKTVFIKYG